VANTSGQTHEYIFIQTGRSYGANNQ